MLGPVYKTKNACLHVYITVYQAIVPSWSLWWPIISFTDIQFLVVVYEGNTS